METKSQLESTRIEELLKSCLKQLGKNRKDILTDKKSAAWKLAIASHLKSQTGIKNPQLSEYLNLGHPATMSNLVGIYNRNEKSKCPYTKQLKRQNN